jgi:hypothetical protein
MTCKSSQRIRSLRIAVLGVGLWMAGGASRAACLIKPLQTGGPAPGYVLMLAPESEVAEYLSMGFTRAACPSDMSRYRDYVDRLCKGIGQGPAPALDTKALFGRSRERACASARAGLAEAQK